MTASVRRAVRLEHRLTQPTASLSDVEAAVALASDYELAAITVNPWLVKAAKRAVGESRVGIATVVAYPNGTSLQSVKAFEAAAALDHGATQIDFVLNAGALASGDDEVVFADMVAVIDMAHSALAAAGVIVEPAPLSDELVRRACRLAERAGADYVVTGTGRGNARATVARARLLRDSVGPRIGVKAAGRFRTAEELDEAVDAGATRVSTEVTAGLAALATDTAAPVGASR
jgi:deoxyribose-phosphate aldolase